MRDALLEWKDVTGDKGNLQIPYDDASIISISLYDNSDDTEVHACHDLDIPTARALHEALGRALAEVDPQPTTDSISATLAACSAPVPDIIRVHPTGAGDHGSIDVTTGNGLTRYAVQQVPRSLRSISTEELAKLGLKPKAHLPSDGYLLECGHWSIHKQWCTECAADIVAISQRASQPEPPPTGNGDLVTPSLLEALADYPELAALVKDRNAFRRTHNGRDPIEDARQELGDLLQYLWQAKMEGRDIHPFLDLWSKAYSAIFPHDERDTRICKNMLEYVEAVRDVTTGSKPASRAHADELYTAIKQDMIESDPRKDTVDRLHEMLKLSPTLHPRPFWWDSNERFGFVNVPDGYVTEPERMTLAQLLECVPNALNAHESHHPLESGQYPRFGFCREHTGPRTLREYLEAP